MESKTPWTIGDYGKVQDADGEQICLVGVGLVMSNATPEELGNAPRIVACVNALADKNPEALEDLLSQVRMVLNENSSSPEVKGLGFLDSALEALEAKHEH